MPDRRRGEAMIVRREGTADTGRSEVLPAPSLKYPLPCPSPQGGGRFWMDAARP